MSQFGDDGAELDAAREQIARRLRFAQQLGPPVGGNRTRLAFRLVAEVVSDSAGHGQRDVAALAEQLRQAAVHGTRAATRFLRGPQRSPAALTDHLTERLAALDERGATMAAEASYVSGYLRLVEPKQLLTAMEFAYYALDGPSAPYQRACFPLTVRHIATAMDQQPDPEATILAVAEELQHPRRWCFDGGSTVNYPYGLTGAAKQQLWICPASDNTEDLHLVNADLGVMGQQPGNVRELSNPDYFNTQLAMAMTDPIDGSPALLAHAIRAEQDSFAVYASRHRFPSEARSWPLRSLLTDQPELALAAHGHMDHTVLLQQTLGTGFAPTQVEAEAQRHPDITVVPVTSRDRGNPNQPGLFAGVDLGRIYSLTAASRRRKNLTQLPVRLLGRDRTLDAHAVADRSRRGR